MVNILESYLERSEDWRKNKQKQLFLSTIAPHQEVVKSTVAGWLKSVLKDVRIDTSVFTAHSTRSASTSKAKALGLPLEEILKRGNWSGKSTWQLHYHKSVCTNPQHFQQILGLGSALN